MNDLIDELKALAKTAECAGSQTVELPTQTITRIISQLAKAELELDRVWALVEAKEAAVPADPSEDYPYMSDKEN